MKIVGLFSFNNGEDYIKKNYKNLLNEVERVIKIVDAESCKTKRSKEKTMTGKMLYSPSELNKLFKKHFSNLPEWKSHKEYCQYPTEYYINGYQSKATVSCSLK